MISSASDLGIFKNESIVKKRANNSSLSQYTTNQINQKPVSAKRLQEFMDNGFIACKNDDERRNWQRNATLVDFDFIPDEVAKTITDAYINNKPYLTRCQVGPI